MTHCAKTPKFDVLGLGSVAVDDIVRVSAFPHPDEKLRVGPSERCIGGLTGMALIAAAKLGGRCAFAGLLGSDELSRVVESTFRRFEVDVSHAVYRQDARPIHSRIIVDESRGTRSVMFDDSAPTGADEQLPGEEFIARSRTLLVDHFGIAGAIRSAKIARATGIHIVADFENHDDPRFEELLELVDHVIVASDFAFDLAGSSDVPSAAIHLQLSARQTVIITAGADGAWFLADDCPGHVRFQPAYQVFAKDTTGCGDVFHGAYCLALARGLPLEDRMRYASAAAALKAGCGSGHEATPSADAVAEMLQNDAGTLLDAKGTS